MARSTFISLSIADMLLIRNAVAGPIASTSVSRRDAINGVQDAAAVSGTELIISGAPTTNALPDRTTCFSDKGMNHCYGILHHWFSMANHAFCSKANGLVFSLSNTNTSVNMTYLYQPVSEVGGKGERGNVLMSSIVDVCDTKGVNGKQGGYFTTANGY